MIDQTETTRQTPSHLDIRAINARLASLADLALCPDCDVPVTTLTADVVDLLIEVTRLTGAVLVTRRESANRLAAIRAALRAEADGVPDPWGFLRDELPDPPEITGGQFSDVGTGRGWCR